jgi:GMP synthase-like glutamine amidotransferase
VSPGIATEVFEAEGYPLRVMRAWEETQWPDPADIAALVVLGGEMNAHDLDAFPFLRVVREYTLEAVERSVPTLGICLGAQILAIVLGGTVRQSPRVELGFGPLDATEEGLRDPVLGGYGDGVEVFQWHEDTFDLPPKTTLLLSGGGFHQAFRYGATCYGTQFHFEVTEEDVMAWLEVTNADRLREHWGRSKEELLEELHSKLPAQQLVGRETFKHFAKLLGS